MSNQQPPPGYGGGSNPYGQQPGPYGQQPPPPGQPSYGQPPQQPQYGQQPGPYAQQPPYGQQPPQQGQPPYGQPPQQGMPQWAQQQPQYEQIGNAGPSGGGGTKLMLVLGGAGLLVVVLIAAAVFLLRSGGGAGSSAEEALDNLVSALNDTDCDGVKDVTTKSLQKELDIGSCTDGGFADGASGDLEYSAGEVKENGDSATGTVEMSGGPSGEEGAVFKVSLQKESDGWLVDSFEIDTSSLNSHDS